MSDTADKFRALIVKLFDRTLERKLKWTLEQSSGLLFCEMSDFVVRLSSTRTASNEPLEKIEVVDALGQTLDLFYDTTVSGKVPPRSGYTTYYDLMKELRLQARRQAIGADSALDRILRSLDES
jgi:hypothetical protein